MSLRNLTAQETEVVFQCLRCVAAGEIVRDDWEFQTLFGIEFDTLRDIVRALPAIDESKEEVTLAINNSLNNLVGCSQADHGAWSKYIAVSPEEVARIFSKWRGGPLAGYFESIK
jgi:hypothetical protein